LYTDRIIMKNLEGKNIVITGAAGAIGSSICHTLATEKASIIALDLNEKSCERLAAELQDKYSVPALAYKCDVTDMDQVRAVNEKIIKYSANIHHLVNVAGGNQPGATTDIEKFSQATEHKDSFFDIDINAFSKVSDLNLLGTVIPSQVFGKFMADNQEGSIVNISSAAASRPLTKIPAYSAAKAGIENFTRWLAVHLAEVNVRVNAIAPGFILTDQNEFLLVDSKTGDPTLRGQKIIKNTPLGRYGEASEIAGVVQFLISDQASFITGAVITVDGGFSAFSGV